MGRTHGQKHKNILSKVTHSTAFKLVDAAVTFIVPTFNVSYYRAIDDLGQYVFWMKVFLVFLVYSMIDRLLYLFYRKSEYVPYCLSLFFKIYLIFDRKTLEHTYKYIETIFLSIKMEEIAEIIQDIIVDYLKKILNQK